jgi:hypothetical protein
MRKWIYPMNRAAQTTRLLGRRFGHSISAALLHVLPPNLSSWKLALYVIVFLLPGGSFVVLGAAWFENRRTRNTAHPAPAAKTALLCRPKHCDA